MLTIEHISNEFKKKLTFFKNNPNAAIQAGWEQEGYALYTNAEGDAFWAHQVEDNWEERPLVIWNPSNFSNTYSRKGADAESFFKSCLKNFLADYFSRRNYSHQVVLWACNNLIDDDGNIVETSKDWFINPELPGTGVPHAERYAAELRIRKEKMQLREEMRSWAAAHGVETIHVVTYENHAGEWGYIEYNLLDGTYTGYEVWCASSCTFGGNCGCHNHEPGREIGGEMTPRDFERARQVFFE